MPNRTEELIGYFKKHGSFLRFSEVIAAGFHPDTLRALVEAGRIEKITTGLYKIAEYMPETHPDLIMASLQVPKGVICLLSALSFHNATTEIPGKVDMAVPRGTRISDISYPPTKIYHFSRKTWEAGIEEYNMEGKKVKIYCLSKTIADCFKFRNKIGVDVAREALKIAVREKREIPMEIMKYAELCDVVTVMKPVLETYLV